MASRAATAMSDRAIAGVPGEVDDAHFLPRPVFEQPTIVNRSDFDRCAKRLLPFGFRIHIDLAGVSVGSNGVVGFEDRDRLPAGRQHQAVDHARLSATHRE
jgi:hypothetical protein